MTGRETPAAGHPTSGLDDTVHQRHRLGILTITAEARAEFGYLRDALGLTPGNLSRHLTVLEDAGLIRLDKGYQGRRPRTWVRITHRGRTALAAELATLTELVRRHRSAIAGTGTGTGTGTGSDTSSTSSDATGDNRGTGGARETAPPRPPVRS